ncbi:hypothetical protein KP509_27G065600 [Ceratopteris richardii]|uniref:DUF155 domain-containing protein n=1 Tax=Ceratopteris richardii TaxID=49495 RepID=A0A8T2RJL0_CERRI|nr:hypothetical protein KP509_27G065600 [Ceratopteris richardii]
MSSIWKRFRKPFLPLKEISVLLPRLPSHLTIQKSAVEPPSLVRLLFQVASSNASADNRIGQKSATDLAGTEEIAGPSAPSNLAQQQARSFVTNPKVGHESQNLRKMVEETALGHNRLLLRPSRPRKGDQSIPVKAFYIARSVDLKALKDEPLLETINYSRITLVARCKFCSIGPPYQGEHPWQERKTWTSGPFLVVFHYGAAVLGNFRMQEEEDFYLNLVKKHCLESLDHTEEARKDDYKIVVRPALATWSQAGHDNIFLQKLDLDNIRVISSVLAQSVALEHHLRKADGMVNIFSRLNSGMEETGNFTMSRKELFQLVASANTTLADLVLRVRLLDRSESAWKDSRYASIWEYLQEEFEMIDRFENMNFKLKTIQKSVEFFLGVLHNRKSNAKEWLIIILISCELSVSLYKILRQSLTAVT